ncbi:MAG: hypothetical protein ACJ71Y_01650, partial [Blastococcus sp.]
MLLPELGRGVGVARIRRRLLGHRTPRQLPPAHGARRLEAARVEISAAAGRGRDDAVRLAHV